jgi:uncharacterized membrane protein
LGGIVTAGTLEAQRKSGKSIETIALAGCSIVLAMTIVALTNGVLGLAQWPAKLQVPSVVVHLVVAVGALPLTVVQLARRKGGLAHRAIGYLWCGLLIGGALVSFFIQELTGGFSPPHLFAIMTVIVVPWIIYAARARRHKTHRNLVLLMAYTQILAGVLTSIPDRHSIGDLFWVMWG